MDDALRAAAERIIAENQKARGEFQTRSSRLMDALTSGDREQFSEAINDILDNNGRRPSENDEVLGPDGETQPPDGNGDGGGPQTEPGSGTP